MLENKIVCGKFVTDCDQCMTVTTTLDPGHSTRLCFPIIFSVFMVKNSCLTSPHITVLFIIFFREMAILVSFINLVWIMSGVVQC